MLQQRGLSLIELLVVITIVAILAGLAGPSFSGIIRTTRQKSAANLLVSDLNQARGEAIKRNATILVCVRNTLGTDCGTVADWSSGWLVCTQDAAVPNTCTAPTIDAPNPFIIRPALDSSLTLTKAGTSTATDPVRFSANSSGTASTLTLHGTWSGAVDKVVTIANTGNISK